MDEETAALTLFANQPLGITTLTLDGRVSSTRRVADMAANLDPHSFVRLAVVNLHVHLCSEEIKSVEEWVGMDQTLSVLLSLRTVNVYNSCKDRTHIHDGRETLVERLPILGVRKLLHFQDETTCAVAPVLSGT